MVCVSFFFFPLHASGIPPDPPNEGHIGGLSERGEWAQERANQGNQECESLRAPQVGPETEHKDFGGACEEVLVVSM